MMVIRTERKLMNKDSDKNCQKRGSLPAPQIFLTEISFDRRLGAGSHKVDIVNT